VTLPSFDISEVKADCLADVGSRNCDDGRMFSQDYSDGGTWDPSTRTLALGANSTVELGGNDYVFCRLQMTGTSELRKAAGTHVRLIFDSPENCGLSGPAQQIDVTGNFTSSDWGTDHDPIEIVMVGSPSIDTQARFWGSSWNYFQLYAPQTDIEMGGSADYCCGAAGKTLTVSSSAKVHSDPQVQPPSGDPNFTLYWTRRYVECGPTAAKPPLDNC
jgi:hypothetical protein